MTAKQENIKWIDGFRGIASLLVVSTHIARAFDEELFKPTSANGSSPRLLQYPIFRVFVQGRVGVCMFSLVTGYVCALKPIRQFRDGNQEAAFKGIAKSAFRRVPRLFLPTTIATVLIWTFCQFGVFEVSNSTTHWWLQHTSPDISPTIGAAVKDLLYNVVATWTKLYNLYDVNQWTLPPLLKGAMWVYVMLFATAYCKPLHRMMVQLALFTFFYASNDPSFGMQFFFGAFLSEISQSTAHTTWCTTHRWPGRLLSPIFIIGGLLLASYPESEAEWMPWSKFMTDMSAYIFPLESEIPRFYSGLGLDFVALGIHFSPLVKTVLSSKFLLWFGSNSFAVYLLHGSLLRTVLVWMVYGFKVPAEIVHADGTKEAGPPLEPCGRLAWYCWLVVWLTGLYAIANLWTRHVDPWCARLTEKLVNYMGEEKSEPRSEDEKSLLPQ